MVDWDNFHTNTYYVVMASYNDINANNYPAPDELPQTGGSSGSEGP